MLIGGYTASFLGGDTFPPLWPLGCGLHLSCTAGTHPTPLRTFMGRISQWDWPRPSYVAPMLINGFEHLVLHLSNLQQGPLFDAVAVFCTFGMFGVSCSVRKAASTPVKPPSSMTPCPKAQPKRNGSRAPATLVNYPSDQLKAPQKSKKYPRWGG